MTYRAECPTLPRGWMREEIPRTSTGINAGKPDVIYYSPQGKKIRSKTELIKELGDKYDLAAFDYQSGKINSLLVRSKAKKAKSGTYDFSRGGGGAGGGGALHRATDAALVPPIRQTASIFKQPVTVYKNMDGKVKPDKATAAEKPRQLFWEKRLSGLRASYPDEEYEPFRLPETLRPIGPGVESDVVLASISTSLHMANGPISGQTATKSGNLVKNPAVFLDPEQTCREEHRKASVQVHDTARMKKYECNKCGHAFSSMKLHTLHKPLISATVVSSDLIERQEDVVNETRRRLAEAINALMT